MKVVLAGRYSGYAGFRLLLTDQQTRPSTLCRCTFTHSGQRPRSIRLLSESQTVSNNTAANLNDTNAAVQTTLAGGSPALATEAHILRRVSAFHAAAPPKG